MGISSLWTSNLRFKCFVIGYMNLLASIVDIALHIAVVGIMSNGFQCDVNEESFDKIDWPWLEPFILAINMGTHGFYPFPLIFRDRSSIFMDYMPLSSNPQCYPGMFHIYLIDILNFMINVIWFKFVKAYVVALHKRDTEPMRMFFGLSLVKLVLQVLYFSYQPGFRSPSTVEAYWFLKLLDIVLAAVFLLLINQYIKQVKVEKIINVVDRPPTYVESLINAPKQTKEQKDTEVAIAIEKKIEENVTEKV